MCHAQTATRQWRMPGGCRGRRGPARWPAAFPQPWGLCQGTRRKLTTLLPWPARGVCIRSSLNLEARETRRGRQNLRDLSFRTRGSACAPFLRHQRLALEPRGPKCRPPRSVGHLQSRMLGTIQDSSSGSLADLGQTVKDKMTMLSEMTVMNRETSIRKMAQKGFAWRMYLRAEDALTCTRCDS